MRNEKGQFIKVGKNPVDYTSEYAIVWTTDKQGNRKIGYKIDIEDLDKVLKYRWSVNTDGYAKCQSLKMHRLIMNAEKNQKIDHINQDKTDNRKENLRFVSHSLNVRNSSKTRGKLGHKHIVQMGNYYTIHLKCRGEKYYIGKIQTLKEAIKQRNELYDRIKYFDE